MKLIPITIITIYHKLVSPIFVQVFGINCRYSTTCSEYTIGSIKKHGVLRGGVLGLKRILSCQPYARIFKDYEQAITTNNI